MYTKESIEQLRQRIDLPEILSSYLHMHRSGSSFKALCPFHEEKTPSFMVQRGDRHYHCFGCGAHGDAIAFLMTHVKMGFKEAIEYLAEKFQVALEQTEIFEKEKGPGKVALKTALEMASSFYHYLLLYSEEGREPLQYLYKRKLDLEFLRRFQIGYAPSHGELLTRYLQEEHISKEVLEQAGLMRINSHGREKDFFSQRITFPIRDALGSVIGFSARKFKEETFGGKYINTPETPLFKKSKILFGLSDSRMRIAKEKKAIIVEGQIDCLKLIHAGFNYTVAGQGTAFGSEHVKELLQLGVTQVYLALDADLAGKEAAVKIGDLFQKKGVGVFVIRLPEGKDPDALLAEQGPQAFQSLMEISEQYIPFVYSFLSQGSKNLPPSQKNEIVNSIVAKIKEWEMPVLVHESLRQLSEISHIPETTLGIDQISLPDLFIRKTGSISFSTIDPNRILETDFLRWLLFCNETALIQIAEDNIRQEHFLIPNAYSLYQILLQAKKEDRPSDLLSIAASLPTQEGDELLKEIMQRKVNLSKAIEGFTETVRKMLIRKWMQEREEIRSQLQSGSLNDEEALSLAKRFDEMKNHHPQVLVNSPTK